MDERKPNPQSWDDSVYGTGPTHPPKSRGGLVALLLILMIFLCGIITVLSVLNIRLFQELQAQEQEYDPAMSFTVGQEAEQTAPPLTTETEAAAPETETQADILDLQQSPQGLDNRPMAEGMSLQDIYTMNIQSVVSITASWSGGTSTGTGVIFDEAGYIITNAHVINGAQSISVQLTDDRILTAQVVGSDEISDLAVLLVDAEDLIPAQFGDSTSLRVGDTVVAIGDPLGVEFRGTYTDGIISAINRDVDVDGHTMTLIQTNAALNSGNSGGPLINCFGQVIGINTMKISDFASAAGVEGLGFAIPSATVKNIAQQLIDQGYVSGRPTLGITGESLSIFYQHYYDLPAGLYITEVERGSDAHAKGIQSGDILVSVGQTRTTTMNELKAALQEYQVGDRVEVIIFRAGKQYQTTLTLSEDKG